MDRDLVRESLDKLCCPLQNVNTKDRDTQEKKQDCHSDKHTKGKDDTKIEIKIQFPNVPVQYEHRTVADTHLQQHCA